MTLHGFFRATEKGGYLRNFQPAENPQLDHFGLLRIFPRQFVEILVDGETFFDVGCNGKIDGIHIHALLSATVSEPFLAACVVHENPAHGFSRGADEMLAPAPLLAIRSGQSQPRLMNQGGCLQRVPGFS